MTSERTQNALSQPRHRRPFPVATAGLLRVYAHSVIKIPTLFLRDYGGKPPYHVTAEVNPECKWVLDGEGVATRKFDGTCVQAWGGKLWRRREVKPGQPIPDGFRFSEHDTETGKTFGWLECSRRDPGDALHFEALDNAVGDARVSPPFDVGADEAAFWLWTHEGQSFELCGPKVNRNPEGLDRHLFVPHGSEEVKDCPRTFDGLRDFLATFPHEGIVWHHHDGRTAKLKVRDFPKARSTLNGGAARARSGGRFATSD